MAYCWNAQYTSSRTNPFAKSTLTISLVGISVKLRPLKFSLLFFTLSLMLTTVIFFSLWVGGSRLACDMCRYVCLRAWAVVLIDNDCGRCKKHDYRYCSRVTLNKHRKPSWSRSACGSQVRRTQRWVVKWREKNQIVNTLDFRYTYISVGLTRVKSANIARSHRCPPGWCRWFKSGDALKGCGGGKASYRTTTTSAENVRYYLFNFPVHSQYRRAYNLFFYRRRQSDYRIAMFSDFYPKLGTKNKPKRSI